MRHGDMKEYIVETARRTVNAIIGNYADSERGQQHAAEGVNVAAKPAPKANEGNAAAKPGVKADKGKYPEPPDPVPVENKGFVADPTAQTYFGDGIRLDTMKSGQIMIPDSHRTGHFFCFGTTRVGKTRVIENMTEQDIRKGYNVMALDPKGDVELFSKIVQITMEERRFEQLMLVTPIFPHLSATINPLSDFYMPEELVSHVIAGIQVEGDAFFYNVAKDISGAVVRYLIEKAKVEMREPIFTLEEVKYYISHNQVKQMYSEASMWEGDDARRLAEDLNKIQENPPDYYSKVSSTLRVALMDLTTGNIGKVVGQTSSNKFIRRIEEGKGVVMICQTGSLITQAAAGTFARVAVSMVQAAVGRIYASGRTLPQPLCLYLDEAQNTLYYGIDNLFSKAGGAGVWIHAFAQSINQIHAELGQERGNAILDNTNTKLFMRVPDEKTAEYVARHFGEIRRKQAVMSVGGGDGFQMMEQDENRIKAFDVLSLKSREFLLSTYKGIYRGRTADTSDLYTGIKFPEAAR